MRNRQWILKARPEGLPVRGDFAITESSITETDLKDGQILVRNRLFLCAPTMRNWMSGQENSLFPVIPLGAPIMAPCAGEVVASRHQDFAAGCGLTYFGAWRDYETIDPKVTGVTPIPEGLSLVEALGPFGLNPQTGYFGMTRIGRPKAGETVVVSGAAGSTGSTAAQIARILGARVIGIAGGSEKCRWLVEDCRLDAVIDYKSENLYDRLKELCPGGIDVFYDNVGGETLQAAIDTMAKHGRIVLCGQIASYNENELPEGPRNMMRVIYGSIRLEGFLRGDFEGEFDEAIARLREWTGTGDIVHRVDLRRGFDGIPMTFNDVLTGRNNGTLIIEIE